MMMPSEFGSLRHGVRLALLFTRAIAVYATSMLPVVAELGFRVRLVRVSHAVENPECMV